MVRNDIVLDPKFPLFDWWKTIFSFSLNLSPTWAVKQNVKLRHRVNEALRVAGISILIRAIIEFVRVKNASFAKYCQLAVILILTIWDEWEFNVLNLCLEWNYEISTRDPSLWRWVFPLRVRTWRRVYAYNNTRHLSSCPRFLISISKGALLCFSASLFIVMVMGTTILDDAG